jgi:ATP-dependent exoDNAse (exonuclease V) alpha subunit
LPQIKQINEELTLPRSALRHVDYGYTVTSFSTQGSAVDRVIVNDDSMRSSPLVIREQLYVSIWLGRIDARVYTNDAEALRLAVTRDPKKEVALDAVKQRPTQELKLWPNMTNQPQQSQNQSIAVRI